MSGMKKAVVNTGRLVSAKVTKPKRIKGAVRFKNPLENAWGYIDAEIHGTKPLIMEAFQGDDLRNYIDRYEFGERAVKDINLKAPETQCLTRVHWLSKPALKMSEINGEHRYGFPAGGIKKMIIYAAGIFDDIVKKHTNALFFIETPADPSGRLVEVFAENGPKMSGDMMKNSGKSGSPRWAIRPEFWPWRMELRIRYYYKRLKASRILDWLAHGVECVGLGGSRPVTSRGNSYNFGTAKVVKFISDIPVEKEGKEEKKMAAAAKKAKKAKKDEE